MAAKGIGEAHDSQAGNWNYSSRILVIVYIQRNKNLHKTGLTQLRGDKHEHYF